MIHLFFTSKAVADDVVCVWRRGRANTREDANISISTEPSIDGRERTSASGRLPEHSPAFTSLDAVWVLSSVPVGNPYFYSLFPCVEAPWQPGPLHSELDGVFTPFPVSGRFAGEKIRICVFGSSPGHVEYKGGVAPLLSYSRQFWSVMTTSACLMFD